MKTKSEEILEVFLAVSAVPCEKIAEDAKCRPDYLASSPQV